MLQKGGNAIDAAVATAFCLGITEPQASGLGGQSMALVRLASKKKAIAIDGSSRAPFAVDPTNIPREPRKIGLKSTTLPSTPATLGYLLDSYGRLDLPTVLAPAIEAAGAGFEIGPLLHRLIERENGQLEKDPLAARRFVPGGKSLRAGEKLVQPELGRCLELLAKRGWREFYFGQIGHDIVSDMQLRGGLLTRADLSQVPVPRERPVLWGKYRGYKLATFPPPGAGRALVGILNILESFEPQEIDADDLRSQVILAHVFSHTLAEREQRPVAPELYLQSRKKRMVDKRHAEQIANKIRKLIELRSQPAPGQAQETSSGETTHLCAADKEGNVVALTQSIELVFGSKRVNSRHGFFYNNYMTTFEYKDMTHPYYLLPGAEPWSSVAPTIIYKKGRPSLTLGSPGSERIATSLAQVISRVIDRKQDLAEAIEAPRLHAGKSGKVQIEAKRFGDRAIEALTEAGFEITRRGAYSFYLGCVQAIRMPGGKSGSFLGVADPRREGEAVGPEGIADRDMEDDR